MSSLLSPFTSFQPSESLINFKFTISKPEEMLIQIPSSDILFLVQYYLRQVYLLKLSLLYDQKYLATGLGCFLGMSILAWTFHQDFKQLQMCFHFSLFYIVLDHYLDNTEISLSNKTSLLQDLIHLSFDPNFEISTTYSPEIQSTLSIYTQILKSSRGKELQFTLTRTLMIEAFSFFQQQQHNNYTWQDYYQIARLKGALTLETIGDILNIPRQELTLLGECIQLQDDLNDIKDDQTDGIETVVTYELKHFGHVDNIFKTLWTRLALFSPTLSTFRNILMLVTLYPIQSEPTLISDGLLKSIKIELKEQGWGKYLDLMASLDLMNKERLMLKVMEKLYDLRKDWHGKIDVEKIRVGKGEMKECDLGKSYPRDDTRLDETGEKYFGAVLETGRNLKEFWGNEMFDLLVCQEKEKLGKLLAEYFPCTECLPKCDPQVFKVKCLSCNQCRPSCDVNKKNVNCVNCNPKLLTFNNMDRLQANYKAIDLLIGKYLTGENHRSFINTLALIRLRLSVLPSLLT